MRSKRFWSFTAVISAMAAIAGGVAGVKSSDNSAAAFLCQPPAMCPLRFGDGQMAVGDAEATEAQQPISDGNLLVSNTGKEAVTLQRAWLVHKEPGLELLGFYAAEAAHQPQSTGDGYSPRSGQPVSGKTVEPQERVRVMVGVSLIAKGQQGFRGIALEYTQGDRRFKQVFDISLRLCAPYKEFKGACPEPRIVPGHQLQDCLLPQDPQTTDNLLVCKKPDA